MRVPARFTPTTTARGIIGDRSLEQLVNTATLPGVVGYVLAMPDMHQGYGFPIGGVVATELPDGVISPGGVGYDINCGVRLLASQLEADAGRTAPRRLATALYANCPSGVGQGGQVKLKPGELDEVLENGARWAVARGSARRPISSAPRRAAACRGPMPPRSAPAPANAAATRSAPSGPATTSSRWTGSTACWTRTPPGASASSTARSSCRSTAARAGWATRSAPTTSARSSAPCEHTASTLPDRELVCAPEQPRGPRLPGRHDRRGQLRLRQPPGPGRPHPAQLRAGAGRQGEAARPLPGLRHRPQHGQGRNPRRGRPPAGALRPPQRGDPRLRARIGRPARGLPRHRAAGPGARLHGDLELGARRYRRVHGRRPSGPPATAPAGP